MRNKYNFEVNKVVYRAIVMMWYRHEIGKLQLEDEKVVLRIKEKIECGLRYEGGEFSKNPSKNMRPEDARIKELANQYLTSLESK